MNLQHLRLRRAGASLLAASLLLSALPANSFISSAAPFAWSEDLDAVAVEQPADQPAEPATANQTEPDQPRDGASSVRQRGQEAPVSLRQVAAQDEAVPEAVGADPGDGPPPARKNQQSAREEQAAKDQRDANIRMWPMPASSYTFTQPFGCVPQIAHFYQPGAGCPADRPVVHTGLDLAAPEGTPFYAAASGWVTESGYDREVGVANTRIIIQHEGRNDGYATEYLHWVASFVDVGDHVEAGQIIGEVGSVGYSTGPHLHFSLIDLDTGEHIDPTRWLPQEPGTEGYRGITPRRAAMRLPAGTTAGVPEHTDPSPPDVPTREDLPESAHAGKDHHGKKGNKGKKAKQREERGNKNGNNREKDTRDVSGKEGATSENGSATSGDKQAERERERTRKRERNKNGSAKSSNASGDNGSGKERKNRNAGDSGSGKNDKKASRKEQDPVEQTDTRDKGTNKGNKNNGNGNGNGNGGGNKKDRQQDDTQQAVEESPAPVDETPAGTQEPEAGDTSGDGGQDVDPGADNPDGDRGNSDVTSGQDELSGEAINDDRSARDKGARNGNKGNGGSSEDDSVEVGA